MDFMSNSPNHNCAHLAVILILQSREKDLTHEAWDTLDVKRDPTPYERFLPSYLQRNQTYLSEKTIK
jgi:hypothetical protein